MSLPSIQQAVVSSLSEGTLQQQHDQGVHVHMCRSSFHTTPVFSNLDGTIAHYTTLGTASSWKVASSELSWYGMVGSLSSSPPSCNATLQTPSAGHMCPAPGLLLCIAVCAHLLCVTRFASVGAPQQGRHTAPAGQPPGCHCDPCVLDGHGVVQELLDQPAATQGRGVGSSCNPVHPPRDSLGAHSPGVQAILPS